VSASHPEPAFVRLLSGHDFDAAASLVCASPGGRHQVRDTRRRAGDPFRAMRPADNQTWAELLSSGDLPAPGSARSAGLVITRRQGQYKYHELDTTLLQAIDICDQALLSRAGSTDDGWRDLQATRGCLAGQLSRRTFKPSGQVDSAGNPIPVRLHPPGTPERTRRTRFAIDR
jgi:hypothetical protein